MSGVVATRVCAGLVACVVACGPDHIRDPDDFTPATTPIADEPVFGPRLYESSQLRSTSVSFTMMGAVGYVHIYEGAGWDHELRYANPTTAFFVIDPATGLGTRAPSPSLAPSRSHRFATLADPTQPGAVLVVARPDDTGFDVARFDGSAWTTVAGPDGVLFDDIRSTVARGTALLILAQASVWNFDGTSWRTLDNPHGSFGFDIAMGPWDEAGARIVFAQSSQVVCSTLYTAATLSSGGTASDTPVCTSVPVGSIAGTALNGTTSDFQALVGTNQPGQARVVHFTAGEAIVGGAFAATRMVASPGSPQPLVTNEHSVVVDSNAYIPALRTTIAGELGTHLMDATIARATCGCDRNTDPTCGCVAREAALAVWSATPTASRLGVLVADDVAGRRTLHVRMLDLPVSEPPYPTPECNLECVAPSVCYVDVIFPTPQCVPPGTTGLYVKTDVYVTPADPTIAPSVSVALSSPDPNCTATQVFGLDHGWALDPLCSFTLDASAPGHVPLRVSDIPSGTEDQKLNINYTLARGGLVDGTLTTLPGINPDETRFTVSPAGGAMVVSINDTWRWIATSASAPGFTATPLILPSSTTTAQFLPARPRFVTGTRVLLPDATQQLHLIDSGVVLTTLTGTYDLSRIAVASAAARAVVPSGTAVSPTTSSAATLLAFDGAGLTVVASDTTTGRGHAIRPDGSEAGFFTSTGGLRLFSSSGATTITGSWPSTSRLRLALGPGTDYLVIGPPAANSFTNPCTNVSRCQLFAREDTPGMPGVRQTVQLSTRALWAELGATTGNVAWLEHDMSNIAHLYHRNNTTLTTTEIALGSSLSSDYGHAVSGDKLIVLVPTGAIVVDLATGASRLEVGTFAAPQFDDPEPFAQLDGGGRIWVRLANGGMWFYTPGTDTFTQLGLDYARFGVTNDRQLTSNGITLYTAQNQVIRTYQFGAPAGNAEPSYLTWRARGAPCLVYWRAEPIWQGTPSERRWYCTD